MLTAYSAWQNCFEKLLLTADCCSNLNSIFVSFRRGGRKRKMASNSCKPFEATKRMPSPRTSTPENSKRKRVDESDLSLNISRKRNMDARDLKQLDTRLSQLVDQFQASCKATVKENSGKREEWPVTTNMWTNLVDNKRALQGPTTRSRKE